MNDQGVSNVHSAALQKPKTWLVLAILGLALPTVVTWVYFDLLSTSPAWMQQSAYAFGKAIQFALPLLAWWLMHRHLQKASLSFAKTNHGAEPAQLRASLAWGLGSGLAIGAAILVVYQFVLVPSGLASGAIVAAREKIGEMGLKSRTVLLGVALFYSLCHSGLEEYYWRWFVFRHLADRKRLAWAVLVSSLGFMAHHVLVLARYFGWASPLTYALALGVAMGGVILAVLYRRFGSLLGPWLSHALVDAAIFVIAWQMIDWSSR